MERDLGEESLGADDRGQFRPQHLDRDAAVVPDVLGQVDGGHAALPELALEAVAVRQGLGEAGKDVSQWSISGSLLDQWLKPLLGSCR